jgi:hypothetical protein
MSDSPLDQLPDEVRASFAVLRARSGMSLNCMEHLWYIMRKFADTEISLKEAQREVAAYKRSANP